MLQALLPAAALLTQNSAAKVETKIESNASSVVVAHENDIAMPTNMWGPPITDGTTHP